MIDLPPIHGLINHCNSSNNDGIVGEFKDGVATVSSYTVMGKE